MAGFKTPLQERAERDIFSKDKEIANKAMNILLDEADRLIEAHRRVSPYQLLLSSWAMMTREIQFNGSHGIQGARSVQNEV